MQREGMGWGNTGWNVIAQISVCHWYVFIFGLRQPKGHWFSMPVGHLFMLIWAIAFQLMVCFSYFPILWLGLDLFSVDVLMLVAKIISETSHTDRSCWTALLHSRSRSVPIHCWNGHDLHNYPRIYDTFAKRANSDSTLWCWKEMQRFESWT